jgi:hypothetical protein
MDLLRSANVSIRQYGQDAALEAARRADALLERGDLDGYRVWKGIMEATRMLLADKPAPGELKH